MKTILYLLIATSALHATPTAIFNGKDLSGWKVEGANYWKVQDGVLVGESDQKKKQSHLWTEKAYADFILETEFRFEGHIDSGFFLRTPNDQIQIGISGSLKRDMTGSPYIGSIGKYPVEAEGATELLKEGEWNTIKITAKGANYVVELNGEEVLNYQSKTAKAKGPIGMQVHQGLQMRIEFRHLKIEELKG